MSGDAPNDRALELSRKLGYQQAITDVLGLLASPRVAGEHKAGVAWVSRNVLLLLRQSGGPRPAHEEDVIIETVRQFARDGVAPEEIERRTGYSLSQLAGMETRCLKRRGTESGG